MNITTTPSCRFGWQGKTLRYVVTADGASEIVVPDSDVQGLAVRVTSQRTTATGVEALVDVEVLNAEAY